MSIYISVFLSSTVFLYAGEKIKDKKLNRFLIVIGLLIPSIIAACRADSVGTDVWYMEKHFIPKPFRLAALLRMLFQKWIQCFPILDSIF